MDWKRANDFLAILIVIRATHIDHTKYNPIPSITAEVSISWLNFPWHRQCTKATCGPAIEESRFISIDSTLDSPCRKLSLQPTHVECIQTYNLLNRKALWPYSISPLWCTRVNVKIRQTGTVNVADCVVLPYSRIICHRELEAGVLDETSLTWKVAPLTQQ